MKTFFLALLLFFPVLLFSQGKLEKAKESLSEKGVLENVETESSNKRNLHRDKNNHSFFVGIIEDIAFYAFYGAVFGNSEYRTFTPHPYFQNLKGEYVSLNLVNDKKSLFKLEVNQLFNKNINALEFNASLRVIPILGIEGSYLKFSESTIHGKDYFDMASIMANYYRIREQQITVWWGIGTTYVGNSINDWGFSYNIGGEIFPLKPISLHLSYKQTFINVSSINTTKFHVKYHINHLGFYTGYHANVLGSETVNGLVIGVDYTF